MSQLEIKSQSKSVELNTETARIQQRLLSSTWTLLCKDIKLERRSRELLPAMILFSLGTFTLFHFALDRSNLSGQLAAAALCITLIFAALLAIGRLCTADRERAAFDALLLAPINPSAIFISKASYLFGLLAVLQLICVPLFAVLLLGPTLLPRLPQLVLCLFITNLGIALIGALVSAIAVRTRTRELITALIGIPALLPLAIGAVHLCAGIFADTVSVSLPWLAVVGLYDMVIALLALAVFDFLVED